MTADWQDYQPHPHMALAQYAQGVPLARKSVSLGGQTAQVLAAASNILLVPSTFVDQPAFQLVLAVSLPVGALGTPFVKVIVSWTDLVTGNPSATRSYILAAGDNQLNTGRVLGEAVNDQMSVQLNNLHGVRAITYNWALSAISHVPPLDLFGNDVQVPVSGYTLPASAPDLGVLAVSNPLIGPGVTQSRITCASNALCTICVDNTGQANALDVQVTDPAPTVPLYGSAGGAMFWRSGPVAAGAVLNGQFQMPNGPVFVGMTNLGGAGNIQPKVTITEQRSV
jgi:hypothetical protein